MRAGAIVTNAESVNTIYVKVKAVGIFSVLAFISTLRPNDRCSHLPLSDQITPSREMFKR